MGTAKSEKPIKAVVIRKYVGTESMESVFKEIVTDEIEDEIRQKESDENETKDLTADD